LNSLPAFAAVIYQLVMTSVLEHCIWQKRSAADKAFFGLLGELFSQTFCLKNIPWMNNITRHYCPIDYDQQLAAIDQVCCRKVSFFEMAVPRHALFKGVPVFDTRVLRPRWTQKIGT